MLVLIRTLKYLIMGYTIKKTAKIYICKHNIAGSSIKHDKYNHKVIEKINLKKLDNIKLNEKLV